MFKTILRSIALCSAMLSPTLLVAAPTSVPFDRPLVFEPNQGQAPSQFSWTARGAGYQLYLTSTGASIVLAEPVKEAPAANANPLPGMASPVRLKSRVSVVGMTLGGSHAWSNVQGLAPTGGVSNYLFGKDSRDWHSNVPQYGRVEVKGVYDGIDLVFYGHGHDLEYDFVVGPGGDPNQIRLGFADAGPMQVDSKTGDLVIKTKSGAEMRHVRPRVYQQVGDRQVEVAGGYQILDSGEAAFRLADYDRRKPLVVDPTVQFTRFLHGDAEDVTSGVAVDSQQNSYVTGQTYSTDFPNTVGTQVAKNCPGGICPSYIFVTKLSPTGAVLNSTLIGGSDTDLSTGIAVDSTGVWVTGMTDSLNFATGNAIYAFGFWDGFVAKLSTDLTLVDWCVEVGGGGDQYVSQSSNAIALDPKHNAYIAGYTYSNTFPTSENFATPRTPKQKASGGGVDAFVVKMGPDGDMDSGYITYLGGSNEDEAFGIAVDSAGHAFVTGYTGSSDFPTNGATNHGSVANGGVVAFVTELSQDGSKSLYSVMLGGTKSYQYPYPLDEAAAIVVDSNDEAYITGTSCTSDFPTTSSSFQPTPPSACLPLTTGQYFTSAFVAKLSCTGTLLYSTYFGGAGGYVNGNSIAIDRKQNIYLGGLTSTSLIQDAPPITLNPTAGFVTKFHPKLYTVESTTLLGASVTNIAEWEPAPPSGSTNTSPITMFTAGYRYEVGSPTKALSYLDAFVVSVLFPAP